MSFEQIKQSAADLEKAIDGLIHPFRQDIQDGTHTVGSPQTITASTEYRITIDGAVRNDKTGPTHITDEWDTSENKISFPTELNSPIYVGDLSFTFDPSTGGVGSGRLRVYIDDDTPKLIRTYPFTYYGPSAGRVNVVSTWYLGTTTGYDAKNDGVYFTVEFDDNGTLYNKAAVIYRT